MRKRTGGKKFGLPVDDQIISTVESTLQDIQNELLERAITYRDERTYRIDTYQELLDNLSKGGFFLVPWCDDSVNEDKIKEECKATIRCYPLENQEEAQGKTCFYSGKPATHMAIFARAY